MKGLTAAHFGNLWQTFCMVLFISYYIFSFNSVVSWAAMRRSQRVYEWQLLNTYQAIAESTELSLQKTILNRSITNLSCAKKRYEQAKLRKKINALGTACIQVNLTNDRLFWFQFRPIFHKNAIFENCLYLPFHCCQWHTHAATTAHRPINSYHHMMHGQLNKDCLLSISN